MFKKLSKLVIFGVAMLILKMEESMQFIPYFVISREVKNSTETHKKRFVQCIEKVL